MNRRNINFYKLSIAFLILFAVQACSDSFSKDKDSNQQATFVKAKYLTGYPKTIFQTSLPWNSSYNIRSDAALVYGWNASFKERRKSWKSHGYGTGFMTGIAWGNYQNYFKGKFDGKEHLDQGQVDQYGNRIQHGKYVPYVVPNYSYIRYFKSVMRKVIDTGVNAIVLEEPEFWARSGYSKSFKRQWRRYYGTPWKPQNESPNAAYMSSMLKHHLYTMALRDVLSYAKWYGKTKGRNIHCIVATHSLVNYSAWSIVSPEASINNIGSVGAVIGQVWTGTTYPAIYYNGEKNR